MYMLPYGEGAGLVSGSRPGADWRESDNVACMVASPPPSHHVTQTGKLSMAEFEFSASGSGEGMSQLERAV